MSAIKIVPYGSWQSPISSDLIVSESVRLSDIVLDGGDTYWVEMRPSEGGRNVIVRCTSDGQMADITPPGFNSRTRVHNTVVDRMPRIRPMFIFPTFPISIFTTRNRMPVPSRSHPIPVCGLPTSLSIVCIKA